MADTALYTASNATYAGIEVVKAATTGNFNKVVVQGKNALDRYLTGAAMGAGANTYAVGYAKNILTGMTQYSNGNIAQRFAQATGLADLLGNGGSLANLPGAPVAFAEAVFNPQNYFDSGSNAAGSDIKSITNSTAAFQNGAAYSSDAGAKAYAASNSLFKKNLINNSTEYSSANITSPIYKANTAPTDSMSRYSWQANDSTGYRSLNAFLNNINNFGVQVQNNFEVEFEGIDGLTLFITNFELPGSKQNTCEIFYDGIKVTIPVNYEHEHEFSMTILNDAQGFIYSTIKSFIELDSYNHYTRTNNNMRVKALTGQVSTAVTGLEGDSGNSVPYQGAMIVCYGVRLTSMGGLTYGQSNNDLQTFTVQGSMIEYSHLPLGLSKQVSHSNI